MSKYKKEEEKEIVELASSFLLYYGFNDPKSKRVAKKIHRTIKNKLATYNRIDPTRYLELVNIASSINQKALDNMVLENSTTPIKIISPYHYLALSLKYVDSIKKLTNMDTYLNEIGNKTDPLLFVSVMFFNRIKDEIGALFNAPWDRSNLVQQNMHGKSCIATY